MSYDVLFLPVLPFFNNVMKMFMKTVYLSFSFHDMQIDSFALLSLASIIVQLESALNSLYSQTAKSIHYFVWAIAKFNSYVIADCLQNM